MKIRLSRTRIIEIETLIRAYRDDAEETMQTVRAELRRRGWTDAQIDAVIKERQV